MKQSHGIAVVLLVSLLALPALADVWTPATTSATAALFGVAHVKDATWVAVGDLGTILRSTDGGATWSPVTSPLPDAIRAVSFRGDVGVAAAIGGRILRSTDAGLTWTVVARPTTKILWAASAGDSLFVITGEEGRILVSYDAGVTWATHFNGSASSYFGVSVQGTTGVTGGGAGAVGMSTDKGAGWGLTVLGTQNTFFYAASMVSPQTGWLAGTSDTGAGIIIRTDSFGFTWTGQVVPATGVLFGVSFSAPDTGTAVGDAGAILHTNDGLHWFAEPSGTAATLNAVAFAAPGNGIAVGSGGTILRATPGSVAGVAPGAAATARLALRVLGSRPGTSRITRFSASLPGGPLDLRVLDVTGRVVATLAHEETPAGTREFTWDGHVAGGSAPAGVYFARLRSGDGSTTAKFAVWN